MLFPAPELFQTNLGVSGYIPQHSIKSISNLFFLKPVHLHQKAERHIHLFWRY